MLTDFQIGVDLFRGNHDDAKRGIAVLRMMPEDNGDSDKRQAQLLMRQGQHEGAKNLLTKVLGKEKKGRFRLRALRSIAAAWSGDFEQARQDIDFVKKLQGRELAAKRLEVTFLTARRKPSEAETLLKTVKTWVSEDWLLQARILDMKVNSSEIGMAEREMLRNEALAIRAQHNSYFELDED